MDSIAAAISGQIADRDSAEKRCALRFTVSRDAQYFRRMLLGRIFSSVRYFATVRRAIGMPRSPRISTISLSLKGVLPASLFTRSRIAPFTLVLLIETPVEVW